MRERVSEQRIPRSCLSFMTLISHLLDDLNLCTWFQICLQESMSFSQNSLVFFKLYFPIFYQVKNLTHSLFPSSSSFNDHLNPSYLALAVNDGFWDCQRGRVTQSKVRLTADVTRTISVDSGFSLFLIPPSQSFLQSFNCFLLKHSSNICTPLLNDHKCIPSIGKENNK